MIVEPESSNPRSTSENESPDIMRMLNYAAGQLTASTVAMYRMSIRDYIRYAQVHGYSELDHTTLVRWRDEMTFHSTKSPNTINRELAAVRRIMVEAEEYGLITGDEAYKFEKVKGVSMRLLKDRMKHKDSAPILQTRMQQLCNLPDESTLLGMRDRALLNTLVSSGMRASELAGLLVACVFQVDGGYICQIMGKRDIEYRDVNLSPEAYSYIRTWTLSRGIESPLVFTAFENFGAVPVPTRLSGKAIWEIVKGYARQIEGMEHLSPHSFRHHFAQYVIKKADIRTAQISLGHASIATTQLYDTHQLTVGVSDHILG